MFIACCTTKLVSRCVNDQKYDNFVPTYTSICLILCLYVLFGRSNPEHRVAVFLNQLRETSPATATVTQQNDNAEEVESVDDSKVRPLVYTSIHTYLGLPHYLLKYSICKWFPETYYSLVILYNTV